MKTSILLRQVTLTDNEKEIIEKKLRKLDKFFDDEVQAFVTLSRKREHEILELTISSRGMIYRSEVEAESFLHAIDPAVNIIDRQIRKNKTRLEKKVRKEAFAEPEYAGEEIEEDSEELIRTKKFDLRPMTTEDAILQMNLLDHTFFVFLNQDTDTVCVVYRRNDGGYGLIETQR